MLFGTRGGRQGIGFEIQFDTAFLDSALTISFDVSCFLVRLECQVVNTGEAYLT
jgi:hypothetical protein